MRRHVTRSLIRAGFAAVAAAFAVAGASAVPAQAWTADAIANIDLTTTIKKMNQTTTYPAGTFVGVLDSDKRTIVGPRPYPPGPAASRSARFPWRM